MKDVASEITPQLLVASILMLAFVAATTLVALVRLGQPT
jgi:hypothetical protein